jgi:hypothetical protein
MAAHKRFRLSFVNAAEDVPRLIRAYGRACFGEFALVLRPAEHRGVMVRLTKEGAWSWRAGESDAPVLPEAVIDAKDAVTLVKTEQKAVRKPGPITLRGQWSGYLHCEDGVPRVELTRKLATYGLLRLTSSAMGWTWTVERTEKWFSAPGSDSGTTATLVAAIEAGLARAMGLLGEACSTRDSRRRAALDEDWAAGHPIRPAKEGRDPTERLRPKEPRRTKAAPPRPVEAPVPLPEVPATPAGVQRMAEEVSREADALATRGVSGAWQDSTALQDAVAWFRGVGLDHVAEDLAAYEGGPEQLQHMRSHLAEIELDDETRKDAEDVLVKLDEAFRTPPYVLERARRLVRHAARLAQTDLCRGKERQEAEQAIERARQAYEEARTAVASAATGEVSAKVRATAEWAALAAAKVARACAAGQVALPTPAARVASRGAKDRRKSPRAPRRPDAAPAPPEARQPVPKKPTRKRTSKKGGTPEPDAEKDKLLLDAFRDAISAAMSESTP